MIAHINDFQAALGCNWKALRTSRMLFLLLNVCFLSTICSGKLTEKLTDLSIKGPACCWIPDTSRNRSWSHSQGRPAGIKTERLRNGEERSLNSHKDERRSMSPNFLLLSPPQCPCAQPLNPAPTSSDIAEWTELLHTGQDSYNPYSLPCLPTVRAIAKNDDDSRPTTITLAVVQHHGKYTKHSSGQVQWFVLHSTPLQFSVTTWQCLQCVYFYVLSFALFASSFLFPNLSWNSHVMLQTFCLSFFIYMSSVGPAATRHLKNILVFAYFSFCGFYLKLFLSSLTQIPDIWLSYSPLLVWTLNNTEHEHVLNLNYCKQI